MEKEQILSMLTGKLGETSFSEQSLSKYVDLNMPAAGTEPDEAYWTKHVNILSTFQGQYNHDVASEVTKQTEAKIEEYKKSVAPPEDEKQAKEKPSTDSQEMKEMRAMLEKLKERLDGAENSRSQAEMMRLVRAEMKRQNAKDDYVLGKTLEGVTLDLKKDVATLATELLVKYDAEYTACRGGGAAPRTATGGGGAGKSLMEKRFERKFRKEGLLKDDNRQ